MEIAIGDILKYIEVQKKCFDDVGLGKDKFYQGMYAGFGLVKTFLEIRQKQEGINIAEALDGKV